jgi:hypothetical protein
VFAARRERYKVAGNDLGSRIRRRAGVAARNLRASAALLLEWFRINLRHGWMGSHRRRNTSQPTERTGRFAALDQVFRNRDAKELDLPGRRRSARPPRTTSGPVSGPDLLGGAGCNQDHNR